MSDSDAAVQRLHLDLWAIALAEAERIVERVARGALGLDVPSAKRLFSVSDTVLRDWAKDGSLATIKVGERKTLYSLQSVTSKIATGFNAASLRETESFWRVVPPVLTPEQVLDVLPDRFASLRSVHMALGTKRLRGRLEVSQTTGAKRIVVHREDLRRYALGLPPTFGWTTNEEDDALRALAHDANGAYSNSAPVLSGSWFDYDLPETTDVDSED